MITEVKLKFKFLRNTLSSTSASLLPAFIDLTVYRGTLSLTMSLSLVAPSQGISHDGEYKLGYDCTGIP
jgi:hypothetical protein